MKKKEIIEVSNEISEDWRLHSDSIRLIIPILLNYAKNKKDFYSLYKLSKLQSTRNRILSIIKKDTNPISKLQKLIKKKNVRTIHNETNL